MNLVPGTQLLMCVCCRFVCPTELTAFSDRHAEFKALNTEILGVSVDSQYAHLAWSQMPRKQGELPPKQPLHHHVDSRSRSA